MSNVLFFPILVWLHVSRNLANRSCFVQANYPSFIEIISRTRLVIHVNSTAKRTFNVNYCPFNEERSVFLIFRQKLDTRLKRYIWSPRRYDVKPQQGFGFLYWKKIRKKKNKVPRQACTSRVLDNVIAVTGFILLIFFTLIRRASEQLVEIKFNSLLKPL